MKTDKLDNLKLYKEIPPEAIEYMESGGFLCGKHVLSDSVYINVEEYETKQIRNARYEAHKDYIDVQIILTGQENIYYTNIKNLTENAPYSKDKDIVFYKNSVSGEDKITLDGTNFVILYPQDAHAPQVALKNTPQKVKKAVIKIRLE